MINGESSVSDEIRFAGSKPYCRIMRGFTPLEMDYNRTCDELHPQSRDAKSSAGSGAGKSSMTLTFEAIMLNEKPSVVDGEDNRESGDCMAKS